MNKKNTKTVLIVALSLFGSGVIIFFAAWAMVGFDFAKLHIGPDSISDNGEKVQQIEKAYDDEGQNLKFNLSSADLNVKSSNDGKIHISYRDTDAAHFDLRDSGGTIVLSQQDESKSFFSLGFIKNYQATVDVLIPDGHDGSLSVDSASGKISVSGVSLSRKLTFDTASGEITLSDIGAAGISATSASGKVSLKSLRKRAPVNLESGSGEVYAENISSGNLKISNVSGRVELANVTSDNATVNTTSGNLSLSGDDFGSLSFASVSGGAEGTLNGSPADYSISADSLSGRCSIPSGSSGSKKTLDFKTTSGNISIRFSKS